MSVFNSSNGTADNAGKVGESVASGTIDASDKLIYNLDNLGTTNLVEVEEHTVSFRNYYYIDYTPEPKLLLEPNTRYMLSFNYKINEADGEVKCGIGYGTTGYSKDIVYNARYPNQTQGIFRYTFTTTDDFNYYNRTGDYIIVTEPYLRIRFARLDSPGDLNVKISSVRFIKVE